MFDQKMGSPGIFLLLGGFRHSVMEMQPANAQRVEENRVPDCQPIRMNDDLAGIADNGVQRQAPVLVADDTLAVLTGRLGMIAVAVIQN
jgi:hypothetical protein